MKNYILFGFILVSVLIFSFCKKKDDVTQCANGYTPNANNVCFCPPNSIETYGQCLQKDSSILFGTSEGCPCKQDSFLIRILGRTTNPNDLGQYQLNFQFVDTTGFIVQTGFFFRPTTLGYDSIEQVFWPGSNANCLIDGWSYKRKASGRMYGNDSLVLNFIYTRPDPKGSGKIITAPDQCRMVVRK